LLQSGKAAAGIEELVHQIVDRMAQFLQRLARSGEIRQRRLGPAWRKRISAVESSRAGGVADAVTKPILILEGGGSGNAHSLLQATSIRSKDVLFPSQAPS